MTREELRDYVDEQRTLNNIPYHVYSALIDGIDTLEQEPILEKINKMKSEIASSLEFWDYSPNNNPLARDILETVTHFWGDIKAESEKA